MHDTFKYFLPVLVIQTVHMLVISKSCCQNTMAVVFVYVSVHTKRERKKYANIFN